MSIQSMTDWFDRAEKRFISIICADSKEHSQDELAHWMAEISRNFASMVQHPSRGCPAFS